MSRSSSAATWCRGTSEIEPSDSIVGGGQPDPGGDVPRGLLHRITEISLSNPVMAAIEMLESEMERLV
jgi:hypothetical protein